MFPKLIVASILLNYYGALIENNATNPRSERNKTEVNFQRIDRRQNEIDFLKHLEYLTMYPCGEPQMRTVNMSTLIELNTEESLTLPLTVLHKCEDCGICPVGECLPITAEEVLLTIQIVNHFENTKRYETIQATNHTSCGCSRSNPKK